jgi:transcriptional regulator with XRE-family HTH domain
MTASQKSFGKYLREKRIAKDYSLRGFAELLGVSPTYLSHVEQGKVDSPPTAKLVRRAAELLGESPDELIAMAGRVPEDLPEIIQSEPEAMPELLRAAKGLTADKLKKLAEEAKRLQEGGEA